MRATTDAARLPDALMRELRYVEIITARRMRTLRVGPYTSRARGPGFEFEEHRLYRPGEDVRRIDWNVTARLRLPFVKTTYAERELRLVVAVDVSRSMAFGTTGRTKKQAALAIVACLLFSALSDQIGVGLVAFADRVLAFHPPTRRRARAWRLLSDLWHLEPPAGPTSLRSALAELARRLRTPTLVVLVSDFLTREDLGALDELGYLAARHDVAALVVEDPAEAALPEAAGTVRFRDLESGRVVRVDFRRRNRRAYHTVAERTRTALARALYRASVDWVLVRTDGNLIEPVLRLWLRRRRP